MNDGLYFTVCTLKYTEKSNSLKSSRLYTIFFFCQLLLVNYITLALHCKVTIDKGLQGYHRQNSKYDNVKQWLCEKKPLPLERRCLSYEP